MSYTIRKATLHDSHALANLLKQIGWFDRINREPLDATEKRVASHLALCLSDASHSLYLAENGTQEVIGYVAVHWLPYLFLPGPEGFISELFVAETARGQGVGVQLLASVKQEAVEKGCFRLSLLNNRQRESYQRKFYEQQGWEERPGMANFIAWLQ